ncbi:MAG: SpoIIE family protein phosphatase [Gemmatimonadales bacterium]|nr:SpoIIE family protein phosphatase [Gemmatimonadales bacterium]
MKDTPSPQGRLAWNLVLLNMLLLLLAGVMGALPLVEGTFAPAARQLFIGAAVIIAWLVAIRFILMDTWGRWFWLICLAGAALMAARFGSGGMIAGIAISCTVLSFRRYKCWRHVSARRRALGFGLGILALVLLSLAQGFWDLHDPDEGIHETVRNLGGWAMGSLLSFWLWSLFHLALRMKLHFLRLRSKLAVSAILIGLVPLLLLALLGVMVFYAGLGGARATRAANILDSWRQTASVGVDLSGAPFDTTFVWSESATEPTPWLDSPHSSRAVTIPAPAWVSDMAAALDYNLIAVPGARDSLATASLDTTGWFLMGQKIWLMDWRDVGGGHPRVRAWQLGTKPLKELSGMIKAGVHITSVRIDEGEDGEFTLGSAEDGVQRFPGLKVIYRDVSDDPGFWNELIYFGGTLFRMTSIANRELDTVTVFINLRAGWQDLKAEFLEGEDNLNIAVVVALGVVAGLFLILEIFALFFGVRISEGIVSAVHVLHTGTRSLGAGDLDTHIELPNEDEFGDLAYSFNEMTHAMKKGREDALAREALTRELANAREIQERLLPAEEPIVKGFQVAGASIPSRQIGGDYFDFLLQDNDCLGVAIGDVSGKGMPAALLMSNLQASLHGQVLHPSSVAEIVGRVNDLLVHSTDSHMFATFFYGLLDLNTGTFISTNAGHNPPLVLRKSGDMETLGTGGLLLGMLPDQPYRQEMITLEAGEVVVLYTDGITEAVGPSAEEDDPEAMFGEEALIEVIRRSRHLPAVGIKEAILDSVAEHTSGVAQSDDITLVVIRRKD